jgi:hypothetical protein
MGRVIYDQFVKYDEQYKFFVHCRQADTLAILWLEDSIHCKPERYISHYCIIDGQDTLFHFALVAEADMDFTIREDGYNYYRLLAYKKLLEGEFVIPYQRAKEIALKKKIPLCNIELQLEYDKFGWKKYKNGKYYWTASTSDCDGCRLIHIDTLNGKILYKGVKRKLAL